MNNKELEERLKKWDDLDFKPVELPNNVPYKTTIKWLVYLDGLKEITPLNIIKALEMIPRLEVMRPCSCGCGYTDTKIEEDGEYMYAGSVYDIINTIKKRIG